MTLQQLRYAVTIADMKSMNKAASELFVSQPALSNTIHDLEEELQIEIFLRTNRGIVVTTEGEEFLSYARQMVELQQMMEETQFEELCIKWAECAADDGRKIYGCCRTQAEVQRIHAALFLRSGGVHQAGAEFLTGRV